jgi:FKBP-type peptidyl-prolyl cis-trans isomerase FklB
MRWLLAVVAAVALVACGPKWQAKKELTSRSDKVSYIIGLQMGKNLKQQGVEINPDRFVMGLKDAASGAKPMLTDSVMTATMNAFQMELMTTAHTKDSAVAAKNRAEGEAFLAANKSKDGVKATPSGLQYKVLKEGTGPKPTVNSTVTVNYRGTLIDGTEFDRSKEGAPISFPLKGVIPGWTEAVQMMKTGAKYEFYIPSNLAYGERGSPPVIGPNATLIFEIELVSFK